jgi:hypothetical protein
MTKEEEDSEIGNFRVVTVETTKVLNDTLKTRLLNRMRNKSRVNDGVSDAVVKFVESNFGYISKLLEEDDVLEALIEKIQTDYLITKRYTPPVWKRKRIHEYPYECVGGRWITFSKARDLQTKGLLRYTYDSSAMSLEDFNEKAMTSYKDDDLVEIEVGYGDYVEIKQTSNHSVYWPCEIKISPVGIEEIQCQLNFYRQHMHLDSGVRWYS